MRHHQTTRKRHRAAQVLTTGLLALGGATAYRQLRKVRRVAPQFRTPLLYLPFPSLNEANLAAFRSITARFVRQPALPAGIVGRSRRVPGPAGAPQVGVITFERADRPPGSPALLWIHGGGFVSASAAVGSGTGALIAQQLNILVASVDYRLAPETPFPGPLDDCYAALKWLHDSAAALGIDPERIAIAGASAGGGLAAALAQRALDGGEVPIAFQLLLYPMLDDRTVLEADRAGRGELMWTSGSNRLGWQAYLGHPATAGEERPYAVPARRGDLAGLPPAWIGVGDLDLFHEEDREYAARLRAAGVPCELVVVAGAYHGFDEQAPRAPESAAFTASALAALRRGLTREEHEALSSAAA